MISAFTQRNVRRDVAMTGEITLRGEVLPIGGVKEKVLAARQAKITTVILPKLNRRDVLQIGPRILHGITFRYVENVQEVLSIALLPPETEPTDADTGRIEPPPAPGGTDIPVQPPEPRERRAPAVRAKRIPVRREA
jgi:ATP-dependent Lon protease